MCTAATYKTNDFYFGRTFDNDFAYKEEVVITPRNFTFQFKKMGVMEKHYAMIGIAYVQSNYPLYYDAVNEKGLCIAGLNFVGNAYYGEEKNRCDNITQYEFIPWILGQCDSVKSAKEKIKNINFLNIPFNEHLPLAQLHWIIADRNECITVESTVKGITVYDNPAGVLTNNPTFDMQMLNLNNYMCLSASKVENRFGGDIPLSQYSKGLGAIGLPGDLSSMSRFVRVAFTRANSVSGDGEKESVSQFFHILGSVLQTRGCCEFEKGKYQISIYTSCCNADKGIYYYKSYDNHQISGVNMFNEELDAKDLIRYPLILDGEIKMQN